MKEFSPTTAERRALSTIHQSLQALEQEGKQILIEARSRIGLGEALLVFDAARSLFVVAEPTAPPAPPKP